MSVKLLSKFYHVPVEGSRPAAVAALLIILTPGLAFAGAEGRWTTGDPHACSVEAENVLEVHRDRFFHYEDGCAFGGKAPKGFRAVSGQMSCEIEGNPYVDTIRMEARGDQLRLNRSGQISVWKRCERDGQASAAGNDGQGLNDLATAVVLFSAIVDRIQRDN